jgi:chemotaxis protein MotB
MAKKKHKAEEKAVDGFMMLFCTLSLILLAFFIFMKTLSTPDDNRERRAMASIRRTFEWLKLGGVYANDTDEEVTSFSVSSEEQSYRHLEEDLVELVRRLSLGASNEVRIEVNDREARIRMSQNVLFGPRITVINPRSFPLLDRVGEFLGDLGRDVVVEGHSDPAGDAVNWELSSTRAASVARYLQESTGLESELIRSRGYAHYRPPEDGFGELRRVEIVVPRSRD